MILKTPFHFTVLEPTVAELASRHPSSKPSYTDTDKSSQPPFGSSWHRRLVEIATGHMDEHEHARARMVSHKVKLKRFIQEKLKRI